MANFKDILNKKREEIPDLTYIPEGEYKAQIAGMPDLGESKEKKTPFAVWSYNLVEPGPGIDGDLLHAAGGLQKPDGSPKKIKDSRDQMWMTGDAFPILKKRLDSIVGTDWVDLGDAFERCVGKDVMITVGYDIDENDSDKKYLRVRKVIGLNT